jgi:hypothetical protein
MPPTRTTSFIARGACRRSMPSVTISAPSGISAAGMTDRRSRKALPLHHAAPRTRNSEAITPSATSRRHVSGLLGSRRESVIIATQSPIAPQRLTMESAVTPGVIGAPP